MCEKKNNNKSEFNNLIKISHLMDRVVKSIIMVGPTQIKFNDKKEEHVIRKNNRRVRALQWIVFSSMQGKKMILSIGYRISVSPLLCKEIRFLVIFRLTIM